MEDNPTVVVLEIDEGGETGQLTVRGDIETLTAMAVLLMSIFASDDDEDCGDPDCPVHGDGDDGDFSPEAV